MSDSDDEALALAHRLFDLARGGHTLELAGYLDAGVPIDLTDAQGNSLLMLAAYHENVSTVSALLARGANPDRVNDRGQTPLAGAVFKKCAPVVTLLRGAGADPDLGTPSARETAHFFDIPFD